LQEISIPRPQDADYPEYAGAGPFNVDFPVTRLYRAYGWLCDKDNNRLDAKKHPVVKGDIARVCVTPDDIAIFQDNVRIRLIDSFTWYREDVLNVTQPAITTNAVAEDRTEIFCTAGSLVCALETNLTDGFFKLPGAIQGRGIVWLQFGEDPGRRLQIPLELGAGPPPHLDHRGLQYSLEDFAFGAQFLPIADPGFAGASPFDAIIYVLPPVDERELFRCRAYECDQQNVEFVSNEPKQEGQSIRMCVRPSKAAEDVGAKMWSVEWWTWSQIDRIQDAIVKQGQEAPDGRTVNFCLRGMDVCFFQTNLIPIFFSAPQPNAINGDGVCWITFGDIYAVPGPIDFEEPEDGTEIDPTKDPLYAGHNPIGIIFPTEGDYVEVLEECPPQDHTISGWMGELDDIYRAAIIAGMVLGSLCCCIPSLFLLSRLRRRRRDELEIEEKDGKVLVNIDVDQKNERNVEEKQFKDEDDESEDEERVKSASKEGKTFRGKRGKDDIDFDDHKHPGTIALRKKICAYLKENPDKEYGPEPYQYFCKKFDGHYFLVNKSGKKWSEATKPESVAGIGEIWKEEKQLLKAGNEEYTWHDLKKIEGGGSSPRRVSSQTRLRSMAGDEDLQPRRRSSSGVDSGDDRDKPKRRGSNKYLQDDDGGNGKALRRGSSKNLDDEDDRDKPKRRGSNKNLDDDADGDKPKRRGSNMNLDDEAGGDKPKRRGSNKYLEDDDGSNGKALRRGSSKNLDDEADGDKPKRRGSNKNLDDDADGDKPKRRGSSKNLDDDDGGNDKPKRRGSRKNLDDDADGDKPKRRGSNKNLDDEADGDKPKRRGSNKYLED
jgi:hypothetical protein